jgi:hypothetical protein
MEPRGDRRLVPSTASNVAGEIGQAMSVGFDASVLKQIQSEVRTIKAEFSGKVPEESIERAAGESVERLANSRVPQFVPLFVGRFTRERLRELVRSGGPAAR